jgi:hypothetical protein
MQRCWILSLTQTTSELPSIWPPFPLTSFCFARIPVLHMLWCNHTIHVRPCHITNQSVHNRLGIRIKIVIHVSGELGCCCCSSLRFCSAAVDNRRSLSLISSFVQTPSIIVLVLSPIFRPSSDLALGSTKSSLYKARFSAVSGEVTGCGFLCAF